MMTLSKKPGPFLSRVNIREAAQPNCADSEYGFLPPVLPQQAPDLKFSHTQHPGLRPSSISGGKDGLITITLAEKNQRPQITFILARDGEIKKLDYVSKTRK